MRTTNLMLLILPGLLAGCPREAPRPEEPPLPGAQVAPALRVAPGWEKPLQGRWRVESTTGKPCSGHVFVDLVGQELTIAGDKLALTYMGDAMTKRFIPRPDVGPKAYDLEVDEPRWKTWSRVALLEVDGDRLHLCVNFPQGPWPDRFAHADDGRECVVLTRLDQAP